MGNLQPKDEDMSEASEATSTSADVTMRAVMVKDGQPVLVQVPKPIPMPGELLIQVLRAGVCSTDLEILKGYVPGFCSILGHEFVGRVEMHGPKMAKDAPAVGSNVVADINVACGKCASCRAGGILRRNHCCERTVVGIINRDGTMAEYLILPADNCHVVPDAVSVRAATFAEPLGAAFRIPEQISTEATEHVAVIGDGKLGLLITEVVKTMPHKTLTIFGHNKNKMALVSGVKAVLVSNGDKLDKYRDKYDVVVEASGSPGGLNLARDLTRPLGTVILKTTCATSHAELNLAVFVVKELKVVGSRCGNIQMALDAMAKKEIEVEKFISKEFPLSEAEEAIKYAAQKGVLKVQLAMTEE